MIKRELFVAFRTEAGTACVARFRRLSEAKAFIRLGEYRIGNQVHSCTVFGPIATSREEAEEIFNPAITIDYHGSLFNR